DFGMRKLSSTEAQDLCEILEERSYGKSVVFTTQLPLDHWSEVIADPVIADAIRDRLEHAALTIRITGESYRGVKARKLATKKKDAQEPSPNGSAGDHSQVVLIQEITWVQAWKSRTVETQLARCRASNDLPDCEGATSPTTEFGGKSPSIFTSRGSPR